MPHYSYNICGMSIESAHPLLGLSPVDAEDPDYAFKVCASGSAPECSWLRHFEVTNGKPWLSVAGRENDFHLRFPDLGHFHANTAAKEIRCYREADTPIESIVHLFLDMVMPLVLSQQGRLVLHAGAVSVFGNIIAFLGETGQGKSSITASFGLKGYPVVTDDCLVVDKKNETPWGVPLYPGLRLWPDAVLAIFGDDLSLPDVAHYTNKQRLGPGADVLTFRSEPGPLGGMYVLSAKSGNRDDRSVTIDPLTPREAFMELVKHPYRLGLDNREWLKEEFQALGRLVNSLAVRRVTYPRNYGLLPKVCEAILEDLGK